MNIKVNGIGSVNNAKSDGGIDKLPVENVNKMLESVGKNEFDVFKKCFDPQGTMKDIRFSKEMKGDSAGPVNRLMRRIKNEEYSEIIYFSAADNKVYIKGHACYGSYPIPTRIAVVTLKDTENFLIDNMQFGWADASQTKPVDLNTLKLEQ